MTKHLRLISLINVLSNCNILSFVKLRGEFYELCRVCIIAVGI